MFTRRTATVTISAPDASTAAAFSSKLLYLPVPTISREVKVRPATVQVSALTVLLRGHSTASHEMDDLVIVAVLDADSPSVDARHDFQVALDRDPHRIEASSLTISAMLMPSAHPAMLAVDADLNACRSIVH